MSAHKSKGLEYPLVLLPFACSCGLFGMTNKAITIAIRAEIPPNKNAARVPNRLATNPAIAKELALAMPTPAAWAETTLDCAVPSNASAMAYRSGR